MKYPNITTPRRIIEGAKQNSCQTRPNGPWVPARPLGLMTLGTRLKATWLVFTGKADAVVWEEGQ